MALQTFFFIIPELSGFNGILYYFILLYSFKFRTGLSPRLPEFYYHTATILVDFIVLLPLTFLMFRKTFSFLMTQEICM